MYAHSVKGAVRTQKDLEEESCINKPKRGRKGYAMRYNKFSSFFPSLSLPSHVSFLPYFLCSLSFSSTPLATLIIISGTIASGIRASGPWTRELKSL